jgi:hypothetical protein
MSAANRFWMMTATPGVTPPHRFRFRQEIRSAGTVSARYWTSTEDLDNAANAYTFWFVVTATTRTRNPIS